MIRLWITLALLSGSCWAFSYKDCGKKDRTIVFDSLKLQPSPIPLPGEVKVGVKVTLSEDIPTEAKVKLKMVRRIRVFGQPVDIPLPCMGDVGSCTWTVCPYLKEHEDRACPFFPADKKCECPIAAGTYEGKEVTVPMADFGPLMNQMIAVSRLRYVRFSLGKSYNAGIYFIGVNMLSNFE
ncbi:ganglioside GM2 activator-like [Centruroides vittatus]|uniref:ganglioside GM2 activator-like n=1 Tax=Centruroides vittatus TaxID=120091 RepID=UPI00350FC686